MNNCPNCKTVLEGDETKKTCPKCGYSYSNTPNVSKPSAIAAAVNQIIVDVIVDARLGDGLAPWQRQYVIIPKRNYDTERQYTGLNRWLLGWDAEISYITEESIAKHNSTTKADAKPRLVVAWIPPRLKKEEKALPKYRQEELLKNRFPFMVKHYVWRAKDVITLPEKQYKEDLSNRKYDNIENFLKSFPFTIEEGGNEPGYIKGSDVIVIPRVQQYNNSDEYYNDLFRQIAKWTGAPSRLDRKGKGEKDVAREELVSEMASSYLCHYFKIPITNNSVAYLDYWLQKVRDDANLMSTAGQRAEKVLTYLGIN